MAESYTVEDSGERAEFDSGMVRDTEEGKVDYTYVLKGPMLERWARHLMAGAEKYDRDNWMKANSQEELERFQRSAFRHFVQWLNDERDEDHGAAVLFGINGAEFVRDALAIQESIDNPLTFAEATVPEPAEVEALDDLPFGAAGTPKFRSPLYSDLRKPGVAYH